MIWSFLPTGAAEAAQEKQMPFVAGRSARAAAPSSPRVRRSSERSDERLLRIHAMYGFLGG
jgi:hypothetical protein